MEIEEAPDDVDAANEEAAPLRGFFDGGEEVEGTGGGFFFFVVSRSFVPPFGCLRPRCLLHRHRKERNLFLFKKLQTGLLGPQRPEVPQGDGRQSVRGRTAARSGGSDARCE